MLESIREFGSKNARVFVAVVGVLSLVLVTGFIFSTSTLGSSNAQANLGGGADTTAASSNLHRESVESSGSPEFDSGSGNVEERKRITSMRMRFEVPDVVEAQENTDDLAGKSGGWVESESLSRNDGYSGDMTVRVPKSNLSSFMDNMEDQNDWKLDFKNRNTDDVTDRYTELSLELENKRMELNRLEKMINQTDEVDELIKIQERMSDLRSRMQYLENELNDIDERVEYVRVEIDFEEPKPITSEFEVREALRDSYRGIFSSLNLIIVGTGYLLPFGVIAGLIHLIRKRRKKAREDE